MDFTSYLFSVSSFLSRSLALSSNAFDLIIARLKCNFHPNRTSANISVCRVPHEHFQRGQSIKSHNDTQFIDVFDELPCLLNDAFARLLPSQSQPFNVQWARWNSIEHQWQPELWQCCIKAPTNIHKNHAINFKIDWILYLNWSQCNKIIINIEMLRFAAESKR